MQVHVSGECLSPGVQHGGHAQLPAEMLGIGGKGAKGGPHALAQQAIDYLGMTLHPGFKRWGSVNTT